jgi:hypothetical protein
MVTRERGIAMQVATRRMAAVLFVVFALGATPSAAVQNATRIEVDSVSGLPAARRALDVTLRTGEAVAGAQNDLVFPPQATPLVRPNGTPFCAIGFQLPVESQATFRFLPDGCARGVDCSGVRAVIIAPDGTTIEDGTVLYTCEIQITPLSVPGTYTIEPANLGASDPSGSPLEVTGSAGTLTVENGVSAIIRASQPLGMPGTRQTVYVTLAAIGGAGGAQNDLGFDLRTPIAVRANGSPDCERGPNIPGLGAVSFAFRPPECEPGVDCTAVRALILALDSVEDPPIPDGSILYSCAIDITATAAYDRYPLTVTGAQASNADGQPLPTGGEDGSILVFDEFSAQLEVATVHGAPGERVTVDVTLHTDTAVAGTQNDLAFDAAAPIAARENGRPACVLGPTLPRGGTSFAFRPAGCTPGVDCTAVRALVLTLSNTGLPDGTLMYSCEVDIPADAAPGSYALPIDDVGAADPDGFPVPAQGIDGAVVVDAPTPTATIEPTALATPTRTVATPTATGTSPRGGSSGSCTVGGSDAGSAWWLLLPLLLLWRRGGGRPRLPSE